MWTDTQKAMAKNLFGRPVRIVLAVWILDRNGEHFYFGQASEAIGRANEAESAVGKLLAEFVEVGMLSMFQDGRRNYYAVLHSPLWAAWRAIGDAVGLTDGALATAGSTA